LSLTLDDPNGHVGFSRFGLDQLGQEGQFDALLRELPAVRPTAAEMIGLSCYQTEYGIFNHSRVRGPTEQRPLASVALHDKEDVMEGGPLFSHIRRFYQYRLHKLFGLSLNEFLELPLYMVELLYDIAIADATQQDHTHRDVQRQLNMDFDDE